MKEHCVSDRLDDLKAEPHINWTDYRVITAQTLMSLPDANKTI